MRQSPRTQGGSSDSDSWDRAGGPAGAEKELAALREEIRHLSRAVEELTLLNDVAQVLGTSLNTAQAMEFVVNRATRALGAEQGVITLVNPRTEDPATTLARSVERAGGRRKIHLPAQVLSRVLASRGAFLSNAPVSDRRLGGVRFDGKVRSMLCAPMLTNGESQGVLTVWNKQWGGGFTPEDERLLTILAMQSAPLLANARLREDERTLRTIREEIALASRIQRELLPKEAPSVPGYRIAGTTRPAQVVTGDYFDFVRVGEHLTAVCLGDVCGKGLSASLLMANLQAIIRTQALYEPPSGDCHDRCLHRFREPARQCVDRSNRLLWRCTPPERFVTLFYGILDEKQHRLRYSNAGHHPPLFCHRGKIEPLERGGLPLAVQEDAAYEEGHVEFEVGDALLAYSDGITEAEDPGGEPFGEERLMRLLDLHTGEEPDALFGRVLDSVSRHTRGSPQNDDMTLVFIRRKVLP